MRPRLLLIPEFTELQWTIRPKLEEWADVRSFDPPGVGEEPRPPELAGLTRQAVVDRALEEIDGAGWDGFYVAADGWSVSVAVRLAMQRPTRCTASPSVTRPSPRIAPAHEPRSTAMSTQR